jgi:hypothetical protein
MVEQTSRLVDSLILAEPNRADYTMKASLKNYVIFKLNRELCLSTVKLSRPHYQEFGDCDGAEG